MALGTIIHNFTDRAEAAESVGLSVQLQEFSFLFFLKVFNCVLRLTKPLSDTLQAKQLNLATAIDLVYSTCKTLKERRTDKYFEDEVWKRSQSLAENINIYVTTPCARKRLSRPPKALQEGVIMTPIGARVSQENYFPKQFYRQRYYEVLDRVIHELEPRFTDNRNVILSVASCHPNNDHFFSLDRVKSLAEESGIDLVKLAPQLDVARNLGYP